MGPDPQARPARPPSDLVGQVLEALTTLLQQRGSGRRPVLALNGPVGAGKSSLTRALITAAADRGLRLAVASIDDAYFPLPRRRLRLAGNPFGVSRVPPGSHDVELLLERLEAWRRGDLLSLPRFDKTLAAGEGDRIADEVQEADALVLEGWLMGCRCLGEDRLAGRLADGLIDWPLSEAELSWLPRWDRELARYEPLWAACDGLWVLRPTSWTLPRRWRFQAEARQRRAGGGSLSAEDLDRLVRASLNSLPPPLYQYPLIEHSEQRQGGSSADTGVRLDAGLREQSGLQVTSGLQEKPEVGDHPGGQSPDPQGPGPLPLMGVTLLDGRRRLVAQASASASFSSAIG